MTFVREVSNVVGVFGGGGHVPEKRLLRISPALAEPGCRTIPAGRKSTMGLSGSYPAIDHVADLLVHVARLIEPVSHKPGSIELRISFFDLPKLMSLIRGLDVTAEAQGITGILGYKLHILSPSATIAYDPVIIPFDFWETFCRVKGDPEAENLFKTRLKQLIHGNGTGAVTQGPETAV